MIYFVNETDSLRFVALTTKPHKCPFDAILLCMWTYVFVTNIFLKERTLVTHTLE